MQKKIIIYEDHFSEVGGVETHAYNLALALRDYYDVKLICGAGIPAHHLARLCEVVDVEIYDKEKTYKCDICIRNSLFWIIPENIIAERYIEMLHADYETLTKAITIKE